MYIWSRKVYVKELKIKLIFLLFKHIVLRSHSKASSLKKCTLYLFCFHMPYFIFWNKKERLEKKFEYLFIGSEHP